MKLFSVFSGCFRLFSVVLLLSVVFGIHKDRTAFTRPAVFPTPQICFRRVMACVCDHTPHITSTAMALFEMFDAPIII